MQHLSLFFHHVPSTPSRCPTRINLAGIVCQLPFIVLTRGYEITFEVDSERKYSVTHIEKAFSKSQKGFFLYALCIVIVIPALFLSIIIKGISFINDEVRDQHRAAIIFMNKQTKELKST